MEEKEEKKKLFGNMSPRKQRWAKVALIIAVCVLVFLAFNAAYKLTTDKKPERDDIQRNVLTGNDTRQRSIDGLSASVQRMRSEIKDVSSQVQKLSDSVGKDEQRKQQQLEKEFSDLKKQIQEIKTESSDLRSQVEKELKKDNKPEPVDKGSAPSKQKVSEGMNNLTGDRSRQLRERSREPNKSGPAGADLQEVGGTAPAGTEPAEFEEVKKEPLKIITINGETGDKTKRSSAVKEPDKTAEIEFYMPTGAIISAMLLNGVDASTSTGAKTEPMPALLRVDKDAILPNRYSSDIKDCFILVSGHGDLASERAFFRGEYLSCIRNDGGVLETKFPSYVVGEDGKAGMKGRLVSKQGQVIARSLIAGFASGVSKAFDVTPVSVLSTSTSSGRVEYQSNYSSSLVQGAAAQGASKALEKVADFYLKMAEQMFPVVEITAGRSVNVIVTNGTKLKLQNLNELHDEFPSPATAAPKGQPALLGAAPGANK